MKTIQIVSFNREAKQLLPIIHIYATYMPPHNIMESLKSVFWETIQEDLWLMEWLGFNSLIFKTIQFNNIYYVILNAESV